MAMSAALPPHPLKERATLFTIVGVSTLSTVAMIAYPIIADAVGLDGVHAGMFIGGTIHDVAQVVGAGYAISPEAGDAATLVKLMRVAMLLPVILARRPGRPPRRPRRDRQAPAAPARLRRRLRRWSLLGSCVAIPAQCAPPAPPCRPGAWSRQWPRSASRPGSARSSSVGLKPVLLMIAETLFIALLVLLVLKSNLV